MKFSRSNAPPEAPLAAFEALDQEFVALGFKSAGAEPEWKFAAKEIRDGDALRVQLLRLGRLVAATADTNDSLAKHLNDLLLTSPADLYRLLAPFLRTPRGVSLCRAAKATPQGNDQDVPRTNRLNRAMIEQAFPGVLLTINDRELRELFASTVRLDAPRTALCLSGGGIRSATFALGVLTALAENGLLPKFDYLSTVSGGGYIGSWLSLWMLRSREVVIGSPVPVAEQLGHIRAAVIEPDAEPVRHLRMFSNYLSPVLGVLSADTWTLAATIIRNLLMIWIVVVPILLSAFLIPWAIVAAHLLDLTHTPQVTILIAFVAFVAGATGVRYVHQNRPDSPPEFCYQNCKDERRGAPRGGAQLQFLWGGLFPLVLSAALFALVWNNKAIVGDPPFDHPISTDAFVLAASIGIAVHMVGWLLSDDIDMNWPTVREGAAVFATGAIAGAGGNAIAFLAQHLAAWSDGPRSFGIPGPIVLAAVTTPALIVALAVSGFAFEGIVSVLQGDEQREWSSRYSAWLLLAAAGWLAAFTLVIMAPMKLQPGYRTLWTVTMGFSTAWVTARLGKRTGTAAPTNPGRHRMTASAIALKLAAPAGMAFCIVILGLINMRIVHLWLLPELNAQSASAPVKIVLVSLGLFAVSWWLASRVDSNKFSLHAMYRARLVRAFLGASRRQGARTPNPFTGFDPCDNVHMAELRPSALTVGQERLRQPFLVINATLNLVSDDDLAWQERKGESFVITPLHAGTWRTGLRRTSGPGLKYGGDCGISLGTAMTISGAAASPNMGYHSSPAVTFLMTLFNARLGCWLGNPGWSGGRTFFRSFPKVGKNPIFPIFREMFGLTDDTAPYVNVTDGGHFENLGVYEMVARRCTFIVVSDAGCDPNCVLEDLGNAIRKVRTDFGVPIVFDIPDAPVSMRSRNTPAREMPERPWAVARILYSAVDDRLPDGRLIYLKPGLYGGEPIDVYAYAQEHHAFPHDTTADQFFSESQFESYRALGYHVAKNAFGESAVKQAMVDMRLAARAPVGTHDV